MHTSTRLGLGGCALALALQPAFAKPIDPFADYPLQLMTDYLRISRTQCGDYAGMALHNLGVRLYSQLDGVRMGDADHFSAAVVCMPTSDGGMRAAVITASSVPKTAEILGEDVVLRMNSQGVLPVSSGRPPPPATGGSMPMHLGTFTMETDLGSATAAAETAMKAQGLTVQPGSAGLRPAVAIWGRNAEVTVLAVIGTEKVGSGILGGAIQTQNIVLLAASPSSPSAERFRNAVRSAMVAGAPLRIR